MNKSHRSVLAALAVASLTHLASGVHASDLPLVKDTYLSGGAPTTPQGAGQTLVVGGYTPDSTLLAFNKNTLPTGVTSNQVARAILKLYLNVGSPVTINIYRVTSTWDEATATYNAGPTSVLYQSNVALGTATTKNFIALDVTDLVKAWIAGTADFTNGIKLSPVSTGTTMVLDSKEATGTSQPPTLEVELALPTERIAQHGDLTMGQFTSGPLP